jgi:hypothetical protein
MEEKPAKTKTRSPSFKLEIGGDSQYKSKFMEKMHFVRDILTGRLPSRATNGTILETVLDFWIQHHTQQKEKVSPHVPLDRTETKQDMYIVTDSSLKKFLELSDDHARYCPKPLRITKTNYRGHVVVCRLACTSKKGHTYLWSSSPKLPGNMYLVNARVQHALIFSGMLPCHYTRFVKGAGIGQIGDQNRRQFFGEYKTFIHQEYEQTTEDALVEEVASYGENNEVEGRKMIDIATDARHGWRKNAKDTSVVAIGDNSHKVLQCVHVTKEMDHVSQRHEKLGTEKIYMFLETKDINVRIHAHDRNMAINKWVKTHSPPVINQNDTWHGVKAMKKSVSAISSGPKYKHANTWHVELSDKVEPLATHTHWAIRNCNKDAGQLRGYLDNTAKHYMNIHDNCHPSSRCKQDPNYEPSNIILENPTAEKLLTTTIKSSTVYKYAEDFVYGKDTYYVESFNNVMNIFQDKRIAFGDAQYNTRAEMAVCHWNENVDRAYTSVWNPKTPKAPRRKKGKKNYTKCTFNYRDHVWDRFVSDLYGIM